MNRDFTTTEVASFFGVSPHTVRNWCTWGLIDFYLVPGGKYRRITRAACLKIAAKYGMPTEKIPNEQTTSPNS